MWPTGRDIDGLAVATKRDFESIRREFEHLSNGVQTELRSTETRIKAELTASFRADMIDQTRHMMRAMVLGNAATVATIAGIAFAAARLT